MLKMQGGCAAASSIKNTISDRTCICNVSAVGSIRKAHLPRRFELEQLLGRAELPPSPSFGRFRIFGAPSI